MNKIMAEETIEKETQETNEEETAPEKEVEAEKPEEKSIDKDPKFQTLDAQKRQWREKAEKLEAELNRVNKSKVDKTLDVDDYIDISASLEGLDQKEKTYLAQQHKLTGKSLTEIRGSEDFMFWDTAYRAKVEKEKALAPNTNQEEVEKPVGIEAELAAAKTQEEKGKVLDKYGLNPLHPRKDYRSL